MREAEKREGAVAGAWRTGRIVRVKEDGRGKGGWRVGERGRGTKRRRGGDGKVVEGKGTRR